MSKWQSSAPPGQPTHTPKIRVQGVQTGSPVYNAVVDQFQGRLHAFHEKHQQQVRIGGNHQYKASVKWPGAKATYYNSDGQELIVLDVDPVLAEQLQPEINEEFWDFVLIELNIPDMTETDAELSAFQEPPPTNRYGYARDGFGWYDMPDPALAYPVTAEDVSILDSIGDASDQESSLLVDLRPFKYGFKFDLYGYIDKYEELGDEPTSSEYKAIGSASISGSMPYDTSEISGRAVTAITRKTGTSLTTLLEQFPELAVYAHGSSALPADEPAPAGGPAYLSWGWVWDGVLNPGGWWNSNASPSDDPDSFLAAADGAYTETVTYWDVANTIIKKVRGVGVVIEDHLGNRSIVSSWPASGTTNQSVTAYLFDFTKFYIGTFELEDVYIDREATIRFVFLGGGRPGGFSYHFNDNMDYNRWEGPRIYPDRWEFKELEERVTLHGQDPPVDDSPENQFGMPRLGRFSINPSKQRGGVKFDPV